MAATPINVYVGTGQMPFADHGGKRSGIFGELMQELCVRMDVECQFRSVPWKRVQLEVDADPHGIALNLARTPAREEDFVWLLEVLPTCYVLNSPQARFDTFEQALDAGPVAVMAGTPRALELEAVRQGEQRVVEVTDPELAARMLRSGRVVAWYEIDSRSRYLWHRLGYDDEPLLAGATQGRVHSYIAASRQLEGAENLRTRMREAFAAMIADGTWQRILSGYFSEEKTREVLPAQQMAGEALSR
ncbi:substrate-binding periplasmic protein [Stutzerimonas azotifigens]|uniref:substrate-binding periplasmic protein n=1 Tax=Stutzerimonas azotifigens TaxID=291995 RepID=UPI00041221F3|nr:transporter substrate-binding domain-containing protein [Stutzerimonas azotifigens]